MKAGSHMLLDVHPRLSRQRDRGKGSLIADPSVPLLITEGIPKADAAVSMGLCCIALLGVWNWRGTNSEGGKTALPDWESIALNDRTIYIAFDSDVMENCKVYSALVRLKELLESRKANVRFIYLTAGEHGEKIGLDDYIAREKSAGRVDCEIRDALLVLATDQLRESPSQTVTADDLRGAITAIMLEEGAKEFIKRHRVAELVHRSFAENGFFCGTADDRLFYFSKVEHRLYDLDWLAFEYLTSHLTGLGKTESVYGFTLHQLRTVASQTAPLDVYSSAYFDATTGLLAVSDASNGVWLRERYGEWIYQYNEDNGLLFLSEPDALAFEPDFSGSCSSLAWFLDQFLLAQFELLTVEDQKTLLLVNLLHEFFPSLRRTRMVPAFLGPQGSGKTTGVKLIGCLKVGPRFQVTGLRKDKEDAFVAAVCNRVIVGFDNADSRLPWLEDALAVYATGQRYRLRRLYTTNDEVAYDPRASILITSRDPHFNRPDVAERILPFHFGRPRKYRPEPAIFHELDRRRNAIWGKLFAHLAVIADSIGQNPAPPLPFRMADFAAFGWSVSELQGRGGDWVELLGRLERAQAGFAAQNDGLIETVRILLQRKGRLGPVTTGELFKQCLEVARDECLAFPDTAQGFGRRLATTKRIIEVELKCRFTEESGHKGQRFITLSPRTGDTGVSGDDDSQTFAESGDRRA
jgi:hypothetical protein